MPAQRHHLTLARAHYRDSVRDQGARHRLKSTVYVYYYHNAGLNDVAWNAFLQQGTAPAQLATFNHVGMRYDKNAGLLNPIQ
jgi:hypothetical protein